MASKPMAMLLGGGLLWSSSFSMPGLASEGSAEQQATPSRETSATLRSGGPEGEVTADKGMVTGTTGAQAQQAGIEILRDGGSAADAVVATAMTQVCLAAGSWVSYAGIMNVVYYDASSGKVHNMNASYDTVSGENDPGSIPQPDFSKGLSGVVMEPDGRTVLVPGFLKGAEALVERFGKKSLSRVAAPAIDCAEKGYAWTEGATQQFSFRKDVLTRDPETRAVFTRDDGSAYQPGDNFRQPVLAETLRRFAEDGSDYIYRGPWAEKLVDKVRALGGKLSLEDMASYDVIWSEPAHGEHNGYDVYVHGAPATGGVSTIEALNLFELAGLSSKGYYSESPEVLFWMNQIFKPAYVLGYGSGEVSKATGLDFSPEARLSKETSASVYQLMLAGHFPTVDLPKNPEPKHSDGVVVVDQWGNVAAMVHSINTVSWGTTGLNIGGISIPDSAAIQVAAVAATEPGDRLPDPTNPGIVMKDGKAYLGFSSIGAGLHARTVAALTSVLDYGMTPQEAINAPAFGSHHFKGNGEFGALTVGEGDFSKEVVEGVEKMGMEIEEDNTMRGYWIGIQIDPDTGKLHGGTPRSFSLNMGGRAVGY